VVELEAQLKVKEAEISDLQGQLVSQKEQYKQTIKELKEELSI